MPSILAYVDPGTGSLIIQAVIAAVAGTLFFFRTQIARGVGAVRRALGRGERETAGDR